jgi:pimeloyl-ACP methyl ester carboxylesterase
MTKPVMKRVQGDGIRIQLAVWEGHGQPVLCIHGLTANCRCWDQMADRLSEARPVIAMDLRGRGLSDKPPHGYSVEAHVRDIEALMADLKCRSMVLMGHSLGAYVAMAFAASHPDRTAKLVLIDGGGDLTPEQWDHVHAAIKPSIDRLGTVFPSFDALVGFMKQAPFLQPWSPLLDNFYRYEIEEVEGGVRSRTRPENIREEVANLRQVQPAGFSPQIACPVLILRATEGVQSPGDLLLPEEAVSRMLREIPHARRVDITGTNHYSILLQPNEIRDRAILDFLAE